MRRLTATRGRRDRGATALVVTMLFSGVFIGGAALTIDVGQMLAERRDIQNGADAAALSLAQTCATNLTCSFSSANAATLGGARLSELNKQNAVDRTASFDTSVYTNGVCGRGFSNLPLCNAPDLAKRLKDCPALPSYITASTKYVEAHTITSTSSGPVLLPVFGDGSGHSVQACSRAAISGVTGGATFPMTFSLCEWNSLAGGGNPNLIVPAPPYTSGYPSNPSTYGTPSTYEKILYMHDTTGASSCKAGPSGADLPGGFGWLNPTSGCIVSLQDGDWAIDKTGNSPPAGCNLANYRGTTVFLPIFDNINGLTGSNGAYHVKYLVAFYLTGWTVPSDRVASIATNKKYCTPSQTCIYGWFTSGLLPAGTTGGAGPPSPTVYTSRVAG